MDQNFGRIAVLMGGCSSEREISLRSGQAVYKAIKESGCDVVPLDITKDDPVKISAQILQANIDIAFIALHGKLGEDGTIQSILDELAIPYPGCDAHVSRAAFDKTVAQRIFKESRINIAPFVIINKKDLDPVEKILLSLRLFPVVVKPSCEGSSFGVTIVQRKEDVKAALDVAFKYGEIILVERFIKGRELTVGILEEKPLPVVEICPKREFFDFNAKYQSGNSEYIVPANLSSEITKKVQAMALQAYHVLGCRDFSRVDVILEAESLPYVLEVNTIPGFTATSLLPKAAAAAGLTFQDLCLKLVRLAYGKTKKHKTNLGRI